MDSGSDILIVDKETSSEVMEHMRSSPHEKEDMEIEILDYEDNWWKRGVKEAIHIQQHKPTLNQDKGRYFLAPIWTYNIEEEERRKSGNLIGREHFTTEEDQPPGGSN